MTEGIEIKGGAGIFEAAVIAVVVDHINSEKRNAGRRNDVTDNRLPAWIRALDRSGGYSPPPATHP